MLNIVIVVLHYAEVLQIRVRRCLEFEVQFIYFRHRVTRRRDADSICSSVNRRRSGLDNRLFTCRIRRDSLYLRHSSRAYRQRYLIHRLRRREARNRLAVYLDVRQRVIRQLSHNECHTVLLSALVVRCFHDQSGRSRQRSRLCHSHRLLVLLFLIGYRRHTFRTIRQFYRVVICARIETRDVGCLLLVVLIRIGIGNSCQFGIATLRSLEKNLIGGRAASVLCAHRDGHRRTANSTVADTYLAAA